MEIQVGFESDGEEIFGVLHTPERLPAPGVVMCHGFTGHKAEAHRLFVRAARDFAQHGLCALRFDFRGSGDSAGEFRDMTISREIADAAAAFAFLASRPEVIAERIGVLGLSLGGCVAACLAGQEERIRALVLWSALAHPERLTERFSGCFGADGVHDMQGWDLGKGLLDDVPNIRPLDSLRNYAGPSLVVHGTRDESVPSSDAAEYRVALGGRCQLHFVEGADHTFSSLRWTAEAVSVSRQFLCQSLGANW